MECCENVLLMDAKYTLYHRLLIVCGLSQLGLNKTVPTHKNICLNQWMRFQNVHFINVKNRRFVVYGDITLKTPVLVRSPKLSNVEPG